MPAVDCHIVDKQDLIDTQIFAISVAEIILTIRVWALWHGTVWLTVYFASVIAGGVAIALHLLILRIKDVSDSTSIESLLYPGCLTVNENGKSLYSAYIMLVVHGAIVFFLMVIVWYKSFHRGVPFSSMMSTFYRDGVIYFAAMLGMGAFVWNGQLTDGQQQQPPPRT
ncbi:hypothetical protein EYR40_005855 [Pleurotus pulmonarius]|nr:hypothetical protein EYR40_005855 [Pleurotus pulmonarius]